MTQKLVSVQIQDNYLNQLKPNDETSFTQKLEKGLVDADEAEATKQRVLLS